MFEIRGALSVQEVEHVRSMFTTSFDNGEFHQHEQTRKDYYKLDSPSPWFPGSDETYTARFHRSGALELSLELGHIFHKLVPLANPENRPIVSVEMFCYAMLPGDLYRTHIDEHVGHTGFIYYLTRCWKFDWGGLLIVGDKDEGATVVRPEFNKLTVIPNSQTAHFVTPVTPYALEPRFALVGFLR